MDDLIDYEAEVHELCGLHESVAAENPDLTFDSKTCPMCADVAAGLRVLADADREEAEDMKDQPARRRKADGRSWFLRPKTPAEIAKSAKVKRPRRKRQATSQAM